MSPDFKEAYMRMITNGIYGAYGQTSYSNQAMVAFNRMFTSCVSVDISDQLDLIEQIEQEEKFNPIKKLSNISDINDIEKLI